MSTTRLCRDTAAAAAALLSCSAFAQTPPPVEAFGSLPAIVDIDISPSGERLLARYRGASDDVYSLLVLRLGTEGGLEFRMREDDRLALRNPFWKRDDRIVASVRYAGSRYGTDTVETRLVALDVPTQEIFPLFWQGLGQDDLPVQIQDDIVSTLPNDPDHILVQYGGKKEAVYKVALEKRRRHRTHQSARRNILSWDADRDGDVRAGWGLVNEKEPKRIAKGGDGKWHDITEATAQPGQRFSILGFAKNPDKMFVTSNHEGGTDGLYEFSVSQRAFTKKLFDRPTVDVDGIIQDVDTGEVIGVVAGEDQRDVEWLAGSRSQMIVDKLAKVLPGQRLQVVGYNLPQTHATVYADRENRPGTPYIFDIENSTLEALPAQYPLLEGVPLGKVFATSYAARDGLTIPAYVTLPPGKASLDDAQGMPFILLPHGGPTARDFQGFDWEAQFLASRGYGVLQMNFRGSDGYGEAFRAKGDKQWGQAMQDDISDGAAWLVAEGYADPARLAIAGGSYGGYAALMGAVKTPDLFQCAAAFAAPTDLPRLLSFHQDYIGGRYGTRHIGNLWRDGRMLRENSPYQRVDDIKIPVFLAHGENDRVVDVKESRTMARRLKRQGKQVVYREFEGGTHFLNVGNHRVEYLTALEKFLGGCNPA